MPAPWELSKQILVPRAKARMQKLRGGGKFLFRSPGVPGGMVMDEIYTCITLKMADQGCLTFIWFSQEPLRP